MLTLPPVEQAVTALILLACVILLLIYLSSRLGSGLCKSKARLDGKVVLITGANTGIGKETAIDLAKRGAKVYIACRDLKRGDDALQDIKMKSKSDNVFLKQLDLASFASVRNFCKDFRRQESNLHILINNAGVMYCPYSLTEDGLEMQMGVNHFGHFLLTILLLDLLKSSSPSRIVNVIVLSSFGHRFVSAMDLNAHLISNNDYNRFTSYSYSKLANILFTKELHRRFNKDGISSFSLHPGVVHTDLGRHTYAKYWLLDVFSHPFRALLIKSAWEGAQTSIYCAVAEGLEAASGNHFADCKLRRATEVGRDGDAAAKLWEISEQVTGVQK